VPKDSIDCLIVGAGFAGLVAAQRLSARLGWKCVVIDQRPHIGGNAHDHVDGAGLLIHTYGPHYFRTNSPRIVEYLSAFTSWHKVDYTIRAFSGGRYWPFPINLNTYEAFIGHAASEGEFKEYLAAARENITEPANSEEVILSQVGREFYERFFEGYTLKQWKRHPRELDASVCGRIPIRTNRDDRYLSEDFQALPADGYVAMFQRMIDASPGLRVLTETSFSAAKKHFSWKHLIFTGPLDAYFDFVHGRLPYRSLRFENESFTAPQLQKRLPIAGRPGFWQPAMQVNYPDADVAFTRIVEIKHATGQINPNSTIVREFPADFEETGEPFYPVPSPSVRTRLEQYRKLASTTANVTFLGRLARYQYLNMDQVVGMALKASDEIAGAAGNH
jgi:UDP-galactopyranose mutase